jgi:hypothetical protein
VQSCDRCCCLWQLVLHAAYMRCVQLEGGVCFGRVPVFEVFSEAASGWEAARVILGGLCNWLMHQPCTPCMCAKGAVNHHATVMQPCFCGRSHHFQAWYWRTGPEWGAAPWPSACRSLPNAVYN